MPSNQRQIEVILHKHAADQAKEILLEAGGDTVWTQSLDDDYVSVRATLPSRASEAAMDSLGNLLGTDPANRILMTDILVELPRSEEAAGSEEDQAKSEPKFGPDRVTREELYSAASRGGRINPVYLILVTISAVVASVGIIRDNTGVVIGAMVIAPLLGPSVALALGSTLGDARLSRQALLASGTGFGLALAVSVVVGLFVEIDLTSEELLSRTDIGAAEVALAVASGIAAALAFTTGASSALIGVMVAVALLPPTVALGMLAANAEWALARGAGLLLLVNLTALNLTAVGTFVAQGVRPARWWEAAQARRSTWLAVTVWGVALVILILAILLESRIED